MRRNSGFLALMMALVACGGGEPAEDDSGLVDLGVPTAERVAAVLDLDGDVGEGDAMYEDGGCIDCHASYGGGTDAGPQLLASGLDLEYVFTVVIDGQGTMPSHAAWTDQELADLGAYLDDKVLYASDCRSASYRCD